MSVLGPYEANNWLSVLGTWQVPTVSLPASQKPHVDNKCDSKTFPAGPWQSATWIGLGGFYYNPGVAVGSDIIQIGVIQNIDVNGVPDYQAFYEWYVDDGQDKPGNMLTVSLPVAAGDYVSGVVTYDPSQNMGAQVSLYNRTQGMRFSHIIVPPTGSNYKGQSCEWVLEATTPPELALQDDSTFPAFTPVTFECTYSCAADNSDQEAAQGAGLLYQLLENLETETQNICLNKGQLTQASIFYDSPNSPPNITIQYVSN